jgi:hypothetical protein
MIKQLRSLANRLKVIFFLFVLMGVYANDGVGNPKLHAYKVVKNNTIIGSIKVSIDVTSDSTIYILESAIKTKYLRVFNIFSKEKSVYKNDLLVYSSIYRTLNNKVKANHNIRLKDGQYKLEMSDKLKALEVEVIRSNLVTLFFKEPIDIQETYSDNLRKLVRVTSLNQGKYKVDFSRGKYNIFHYKNGKCERIDAFNSLFHVSLIPV